MQSLLSSIANSQDYNVLQRMCKIRNVSTFSTCIIFFRKSGISGKVQKTLPHFFAFSVCTTLWFYMKNDKHSTATINLWIRRVAEDLHLRKRAPYFEEVILLFLALFTSFRSKHQHWIQLPQNVTICDISVSIFGCFEQWT